MTCTKESRLKRIERNMQRIEELMLELRKMSVPIDVGNAKAELMVIEGDRSDSPTQTLNPNPLATQGKTNNS